MFLQKIVLVKRKCGKIL